MKSKILAIPYIIWMIIFTLIPLGLVIFFAMTTQDGKFTFSNIVAMNDYLDVLFRSIEFSVIATVICLVLGLPVAYLISC